MKTVKSPKFQVVIPLDVRRRLGIRPGAKLQVVDFGGALRLVPLEPPSALRGIARGINVTIDDWMQDAHVEGVPSVRFMPKLEPTAFGHDGGPADLASNRKQVFANVVAEKQARRSKRSDDAPSD